MFYISLKLKNELTRLFKKLQHGLFSMNRPSDDRSFLTNAPNALVRLGLQSLILFVLCLGSTQVKASHFMGGDIYYECTGPNTYLVTFKLYRDCNGISPSSSYSLNINSPTCGSASSVTLSLVGSPAEITPLCPSQPSACSGSGTYGVQEWIYQGTVSGLSSCTDWVLSWAGCCRNNAITTLSNPGSDELYISAVLDNTTSTCNNSPVFNSLPTPFVCVNQPVNYSHGAADPDGDSLVFSLVDCRDAANVSVGYSNPYSGTNPVPTNNISIDPATGNISFIPSATAVAVLCIQVEEYRNNVKIGETTRDIQFSVIDCTSGSFANVAPTATGVNGTNDFFIDVCAGSPVNFNVNTTDPDVGQTVSITPLNTIQGASFTTNGAANPTGTFTWQTTPSDSGFYNLTLDVRDDACPILGINVYSYYIRVLPGDLTPAYSQVNPSAVGACDGSITVSYTNNTGHVLKSWSTGDTSNTITNLCAGAYSVTLTDGSNCPIVDNFNLLDVFTVAVTDTTSVTCNGGSNGTASLSVTGGNMPYTIGGQSYNTSNIVVTGLSHGLNTLTVTDANNRIAVASVTLANPTAISIVADTIIDAGCAGNDGEIVYSISNAFQPITTTWSPNTGTSQTGGVKGVRYTPAIISMNNDYNREYTCVTFDDISSSGTSTGLADDGSTVVTLPFSFDFYGSTESSLTIGNNGGIGFTSSGLPLNGSPSSAPRGIYALLTDIDSGNGDVYYETKGTTPNRRFIVQWHQRPHFSGFGATDFATFQVVLYETSNIIELVYEDLTYNSNSATYDNGVSASVGIASGATLYDEFLSAQDTFPTLVCLYSGSGLAPNTYTITVTDAQGCTNSAAFTVGSSGSSATFTAPSVTAPSCSSATNGTITVNAATTGSAPLEYSINGGMNWQSSNIFNNIGAGSYNLLARLAADTSCVSSFSSNPLAVSAPNLPAITNIAVIAPFCPTATGSITITASAAQGEPIEYSIDNGINWQSSNVFSNVIAGNYVPVVRYVNNTVCQNAGAPVIINAITCYEANVTATTNVSCPNGNDGTATISVVGGTAPYTVNGQSYNTNPFIVTGLSDGAVTFTVTDSLSNSDTASTTINTTPDNTAPTVATQNITVYLDATGNATITAADIDNGSSDNCGIATTSLNTTSFNCSDVGANTVTLTVTDVNGNQNTGTATVTVADTTSPTVATQNITVQLDATGNASITAAQIDNGSADNCGITSTSLDVTSFDCSNAGANTVTLTVTDVNGNSNTGTATVTVEDNIDPVAVAQDITVSLDANGQATIAAADVDNASSDNCSVASLAVAPSAFDCTNIGANNVTLTVTDASGNTNTTTAVVTVEDNAAPSVTTQDITVQLDANGQASITTADVDNGSSDNCGIATQVLDITGFDCSNVGANTVTLTITDVNGNTASNTAIVTVEDTEAPTAIARNITVQLDESGQTSITAADIDNGSSDNCGIQNVAINVSGFDCADLGENTVTLSVTDVSGNTSTATAIVTVVDNEMPTLVCQSYEWDFDATGVLELQPEDLIINVNDNCDYTTTMSQSTFDDSNIGENLVIVTATDDAGNVTTCETIVDVRFGCLSVNEIITPNGDGKNDIWEVDCIAAVNNEIEIYNRFGQLVYNATNYTGGWTGVSNDGEELPQEAYYYVIKVSLGNSQEIFKGNITVIRK